MTARTQGWEGKTVTASGKPPIAARVDSNGVVIGPWTESVQRLNKSFWDGQRKRF